MLGTGLQPGVPLRPCGQQDSMQSLNLIRVAVEKTTQPRRCHLVQGNLRQKKTKIGHQFADGMKFVEGSVDGQSSNTDDAAYSTSAAAELVLL